MSNNAAVATRRNETAVALEAAAITGDLSKMEPADRLTYYNKVCASLGLNPLTKPFAYITLNGKLTLYALRDATDQLRKLHRISVEIVSREMLPDAGLYVVTARARDLDGRTDESVGAVNVKNLGGENLANALMKAETKAKRRVTLSIAGLGWLDESEAVSEAVSVPGARVVDMETGEVGPAPAIEAPRWSTKELAELLKDAGLVMRDLEIVLNEQVTKESCVALIGGWLADDPARTLSGLVREALDALTPTPVAEAAEEAHLPFE